ncbi:hypothetical protein OROMI_028695 [Orobanche minor]
MEDSENSCLLCIEDESSLNEQYHYKDENLGFCSVSDCDSVYIEMLIKKETIFRSNTSNLPVESELQCARVAAVKWILDQKRVLFGFHFRTAYLSVIYFDLFLSTRSIDNGKLWAVRLLSVACLSLAAKMEECEAPALSSYRIDEYDFEGNMIQRMELLVLNTLEWKMSFATPFAYLNFFIIKFGQKFRRKDVIDQAVGLILAVMGEINVVELRPAIVAAAAVLAACDHHLTGKLVEIKMNKAVPSWGSLEREHVYSCYNLLREIGMLKPEMPGLIISRNLSSSSNR